MNNIHQSNNKRIAKNTLLLYVRTFITMTIALYTSRVILKVLGVDDFGIYNVVGGFVGMFSLISSTLVSSTQRFITFELGKKQDSHFQEIFSTAVTIHVIIALVIIILAESIGLWFLNSKMQIPSERLVAANWVFQFSLMTFLMNLISTPYNATILAYEKMAAFAYITLFESVLKLISVLFLLLISYDKLIIYGFLMLMIALIIRTTYSVYCSRNFQECKYIIVREKSYYKQILGFSGWNVIGSSSGVLTNYGLNILLNLFFGVTVNAARGIAIQLDSAINQFASNFTMAINPQITKYYAAGEFNYMMQLVIRSSRYCYYLLLIMSIPVLFETEYILSLWLKVVPAYTIVFVRLSLIYTLCQSFSNPLYTAMLATGKIRNYQIFVGGMALLSFPLSYVLFELSFPPESCYYITIFISISCLAIRVGMLRNMINLSIRFFIKEVLFRSVVVTVLSIIVPCFIVIVMPNGIFRLCVLILSSMIITNISVLFLGISKEEHNLFLKIIRNKIRK